jgi:hypothetical protein
VGRLMERRAGTGLKRRIARVVRGAMSLGCSAGYTTWKS